MAGSERYRGRSRGRREHGRLFLTAASAIALVVSLAACTRPDVGDCADIRENSLRKADCSSPDAFYRVIAVQEDDEDRWCRDVPGTDKVYHHWSGRGTRIFNYSVCLAINIRSSTKREGNSPKP